MPYVNSKAEPPVTFEMRKIERDHLKFIIYKIYQFDNIPVFCLNEDNDSIILHKGVIYTRTMRMYETAPIQNQSEMNEIKEMIIDRNLELIGRRLQQIRGRGQDIDQFNQEIGGL